MSIDHSSLPKEVVPSHPRLTSKKLREHGEEQSSVQKDEQFAIEHGHL